MEPVTHVLTGACLSRTGLNRYAAYATLTMAVAAQFPDIDTLWSLQGPVDGFTHHRGITHTFLGLPFEAAIVVGAVYGLHRIRVARAARKSLDRARAAAVTTSPTAHREPTDSPVPPPPLTAVPVRWGRLYGLALIALLSHLLLDYSNNYGLRPFFPFNPHWYAASIVFIFDPLIFALLLLALVAPSIFRLIGVEIGARKQPFAGRGWAVAAFVGIAGLWTLRAVEHNRVVNLAMAESFATPQPSSFPDGAPDSTPAPQPVFLSPQRVLVNPDPLSPFRWYTVTDFGSFYQLGEADALAGSLVSVEGIYSKPDRSPATLAAEASSLGKAYLDWSPMPIITVAHPEDSDAAGQDGDRRATGRTLVTFRNPRFMGDIPVLHMTERTPLTGAVELDEQNRVVRESMDGRSQR
jgi:inner membrane protein